MSDSNRGYRLAALGASAALAICALATGAYFGSLYGPANKQYHAVDAGQTSDETYHGVTESLPDIALVPDPVERAIANPPPKSGEDHEQRDLAAQESMAAWAFYMAIFAGLTALVTFVGTILIWKQVSLTREAVVDTGKATEAMERANDISVHLGQAQVRAYLNIEKVKCRRAANGMAFRASVQNSGNSPALAAQILIKIIRSDGSQIVVDPNEEHTVPAQSIMNFADCYWLYDTEIEKGTILIIVEIAYADVFGGITKISERFAAASSDITDKYKTMVPGRTVASYLRASEGQAP